MTKQRTPVSFERAIVRISDVLGWKLMGELLGKSARTVQDYSDEDVATCITLHDAFTLEAAYRDAGGEGAPISDCWSLRLKKAAATACRDELFRRVAIASKEGGEAQVALINALAPGADAVDRRAARREVQEHIEALTATLPLLDEGTGPEGATREGTSHHGGDTSR